MQDQNAADAGTVDLEGVDTAYALDRAAIEAILGAVQTLDKVALEALLAPLHSADIADVLEQISGPERRELLALWGTEIVGGVLVLHLLASFFGGGAVLTRRPQCNNRNCDPFPWFTSRLYPR